VSLVRFLEVPH